MSSGISDFKSPDPSASRGFDTVHALAPSRVRDITYVLARFILGGMFIYMGFAKAFDPVDFLKLIRQYHMVPESAYLFLNLIAVALPWVEILCGLLLVLGIAVRGAGLLLGLLLTGFTIAIFLRALGIYHAQGIPFCAIKFDCGCGAGEVYTCHKLPENAALWVLAWITVFSRSRRWSLWPRAISPKVVSPGTKAEA
jgi:uncharacterized membrane protein YphA (DoxX/SURF4 family)